MSNVNKPISLHATFPVTLAADQTSGMLLSATGAAAASFQDFVGVLLYDTKAGENGEVALPGSVVYAIVNSAGALSAGQTLKVSSGKFVATAAGTDPVNGILLEAHAGGGDKLVKVLVK